MSFFVVPLPEEKNLTPLLKFWRRPCVGVSNGESFYRDQKYRRSRVGGEKDSKDKTGGGSSPGQGRRIVNLLFSVVISALGNLFRRRPFGTKGFSAFLSQVHKVTSRKKYSTKRFCDGMHPVVQIVIFIFSSLAHCIITNVASDTMQKP